MIKVVFVNCMRMTLNYILKMVDLDSSDLRSYRPISNPSVLSKLYLKDSLLASSLPISTQTVCYQDSSRRYGVSSSPLNEDRCAEGLDGHSSCSRRPSTRSIMVFFCIDWTLPIRAWDQYNNGFNPTCQTGYSTCESDLPPHHPAPWIHGVWCTPGFRPWCHTFPSVCDDLQLIVESHGLCPHPYADDSQIYGSCRPAAYTELQSRIATCIDHVAEWMRSNRFQLNAAKTEILWSATSR